MPSSRPRFAPVTFAAPLGGRVRLITALAGLVPAGLLLNGLGFPVTPSTPPEPRLLYWLTVSLLVVGFALIAWFSQVRGYQLTSDALVVRRRHRESRFALAGLARVEVDPAAMEWSLRVFGNDGLGAITGRFRNRRLGSYRALVTDRRRAVVLRWTDLCLVVSPDRPEEFAREARARAGLKT